MQVRPLTISVLPTPLNLILKCYDARTVTNLNLHGYLRLSVPLGGDFNAINGVVHELRFCRKCNDIRGLKYNVNGMK